VALLSAVTSPQYTTLRESTHYQSQVYCAVLPVTVVYECRVDGAPSGTTYAEIDIDGHTGTYADIIDGMRVQVATDSGFTDIVFDGRIRAAGTSDSTLKIDETAANISDNDYVRVLDDFPIAPRKPRVSGSIFYVDYDLSFEELPPIITDLKPVYAGFTSSGALSIDFAPTVTAAADGASISSYSWNVGDNGTITTGTSSDKDITAEFTESMGFIHFTATDDNGVSLTRHILIVAVDDTEASFLNHDFETVSTSNKIGEGVRANATFFGDTSDWLDKQLVTFFCVDAFDGSEDTIQDNIAFYGRRSSISDESATVESGDMEQQTAIEFIGSIAQLSQYITFPFTLDDAAASEWFQVNDLTVWRGLWFIMARMTTAAEVVEVSFDDTTETYRIGDTNTQGSNAFEQLTDLAGSLSMALQETWAGALNFSRRAVIIEDDSDRSSVQTVASWTNADFVRVNVADTDFDPIGIVNLYSGSFDPSTGVTTAYQTVAPGLAYGTGSESITINRQIVASTGGLTEARYRVGNEYAVRQPRRELSVEFLDGYWWVIPDVQAWYAFTVEAGTLIGAGAIPVTLKWWCNEVSVTHNAVSGTKRVEAVFIEETQGSVGYQVITPTAVVESYQTQDDNPIVLPDLGIDFEELDMGGFTVGTGSYNSDDDTIDGTCSGSGTIILASRSMDSQCTIGVRVSAQYADIPTGSTLSVVFKEDSSTVQTVNFTFGGTEVQKVFEQTFNSVRTDEIEITVTPSGSCTGSIRLFNVDRQVDQFSEDCDDVNPQIVQFSSAVLSAEDQIVSLGSLPDTILGMYLKGQDQDCGFGRAAQLIFETDDEVQQIIITKDGGDPDYVFRGRQEDLDLLIAAGVEGADTAGLQLDAPLNIAPGTNLQYRGGSSAANCYPATVQGWVVVDI
jgi:hypothetical protein